jgi:hypothetical protein
LLHKLRDIACEYLGYALFLPPAILTHAVWSLWGMLAYPLALLGCDAKTIKEPYVLVVGPMYVSSKLWKSWMYFGCEPEAIRDRNGVPTLVIDKTFAARWWAGNQRWYSENLRGNETNDGHTAVERK